MKFPVWRHGPIIEFSNHFYRGFWIRSVEISFPAKQRYISICNQKNFWTRPAGRWTAGPGWVVSACRFSLGRPTNLIWCWFHMQTEKEVVGTSWYRVVQERWNWTTRGCIHSETDSKATSGKHIGRGLNHPWVKPYCRGGQYYGSKCWLCRTLNASV